MLGISLKHSPKIYLITLTVAAIATVLMLNFQIAPPLIKTMAELSAPEAETMKNKVQMITIGTPILVFLLFFYFWRLDDKLEKEKRKIEMILKTNPQDPAVLGQLEQIEKKRKKYIAIIEPIFMLIFGAIIGFMSVTIITPLYSFMGKL